MKVFKYYLLERKSEVVKGLPYYYRGEQVKLGDRFVLLYDICRSHPSCYEPDWVSNIERFLEEVGDEAWFDFETLEVFLGDCECPEEFENPEELHDFYHVDLNCGVGRRPSVGSIVRKEADEPHEIEISDFFSEEAFSDDKSFFNGVEIKAGDKFEILFGGKNEWSSIIIEAEISVDKDGNLTGLNEVWNSFYEAGSDFGNFEISRTFLNAIELQYRLIKQ